MRALGPLRQASAAVWLALLAALFFSGWGLMAGYVPSEAEAFDSVLYHRKLGDLGALLRSVHSHAASGLVGAGALYLLTSYLTGALYESPRGWWLTLTAYLVILGVCFTGFLLPMDQDAYWGTIVRLGIVESSPLVGPPAADLLRGGAVFNASTLPRFHALHAAILPVALLLLLLPLRGALRDAPPRLYLVATLALVAVYAVASLAPAVLEPRADATDTDYVPRPEWYFLWLFQLGKYLEAVPWVRSLLLPAAGLGFLYALPLLRPPSLSTRLAVAGAWCLAFSGLTALSRWEDRALPGKPTYEAARALRAAAAFKADCVDCHGEGGRGDGPQARAFGLEARDFTSRAFWSEMNEERIVESIRNGKGEDMPAFGRKLDPEVTLGLAAYLKTRFQPREVK